MKHFLLMLFIFLFGSMSFAAPDFDTNYKTVTYDTSYNIALWNKLVDNFSKKYLKSVEKSEYGMMHVYSYPTGSNEKEVTQVYAKEMKPDNYKIYSIE